MNNKNEKLTPDLKHFVYYTNKIPYLYISSRVADPDPGSGAFLTPGSGMGKK
jgi:hypothetical protein